MEGVLILWELVFGGGHLEAGRNFFLLGCIFPWGYSILYGEYYTVKFGGVAIFSRGMATFHIGIVYLLVKDI